jgi:hypothetical protein
MAPAVKPAVAAVKDPFRFWFDFFSTTKYKTPAEAEAFLFQTVRDMLKAGRLDHAEAAIKAFLKPECHQKDAQPWMYELLVKCIESRKATDPVLRQKDEEDIKRTLGFAAFLAKRSKNPMDMLRIADMMTIRKLYGPVGDPGYETNIGELIDFVADKEPANAYPPMMSINLAGHDKDPKRMADAAERLLSLGWPGLDDKMRRDVKEQVKALADALRVDGRTEDADALMASLAESEARDVYIRLTWKGEADIDMSVAEPLGATAKFGAYRTVLGGAIIKNGYGNHPEEVYVCPRAFDGDYAINVEKIVDYDEKKPVKQATLEVILHEGTAEERRESHKIDLDKPQPIVVRLPKGEGRRKVVLPYIAPPERPVAAPTAPKPKDATKNATAPAAPPFAPPR